VLYLEWGCSSPTRLNTSPQGLGGGFAACSLAQLWMRSVKHALRLGIPSIHSSKRSACTLASRRSIYSHGLDKRTAGHMREIERKSCTKEVTGKTSNFHVASLRSAWIRTQRKTRSFFGAPPPQPEDASAFQSFANDLTVAAVRAWSPCALPNLPNSPLSLLPLKHYIFGKICTWSDHLLCLASNQKTPKPKTHQKH